MSKISRRVALGAFAATLAGGAAGVAVARTFSDAMRRRPVGSLLLSRVTRSSRTGHIASPTTADNPITMENALPGTREWQPGHKGTRDTDDIGMQIKGYTSLTSVNTGDAMDFHVRTARKDTYVISIYRLGHYRGTGARHLLTSPMLRGVPQPAPGFDEATGLVTCGWDPVWRLNIPDDWTSGFYLATFTTDSGWRSYAPFVVRDDHRAADLCVVLPFTTYQAYNRWPLDHKLGKSMYNGYEGRNRSYSRRAVKVSFDRPFDRNGFPSHFDTDHDFVRWVEHAGYNVTYATSIDLHDGRVDPTRYAGLVFCGHDEYWTAQMREVAHRAVAHGTHLGFMMANNMYWHIRLEPSPTGQDNRVVVCYKSDPDPGADASGATKRWREIHLPEQALLGVQYNGMLATPAPLVVQAADHWFWTGCGVRNGDRIEALISGEADGLNQHGPHPSEAAQTLLSASPYTLRDGTPRVQNTSVYETTRGGVVFVAATFGWPLALNRPGQTDIRIQRATRNLFDRMLRPRTQPR